MGRKSSAKATSQSAPSARPPEEPPRSSGLAIAGVVAVVAVVGLLFYSRGGSAPAPAAPQQVQSQAAPRPGPDDPPAAARFGPHRQSRLPPMPWNVATPVRPFAEVTEAYTFAAEHPEVLGYVPCYCGCEREGHRGNDDCFVQRRAANGDVLDWEPHGMT